MPRSARMDTPGTLHHVMLRGIERGDGVYDGEDREDFVDRMGDQPKATETGVYAWALIGKSCTYPAWQRRICGSPSPKGDERIKRRLPLNERNVPKPIDGSAGGREPDLVDVVVGYDGKRLNSGGLPGRSADLPAVNRPTNRCGMTDLDEQRFVDRVWGYLPKAADIDFKTVIIASHLTQMAVGELGPASGAIR